MSLYELAILGAATPDDRATLTATIAEMVGEFGLALNDEVIVHDGTSIFGRDKHTAFAAVYFGGTEQTDLEAARELVLSSAPVIPSVGLNADFNSTIPDFLQPANGFVRGTGDPAMSELAAAMLECVGLLRQQRRVFVSYRRVESRAAAVQLHDLLTARGFDVFLDTHDIRPGDPFQDVLWHRLVDSDVMVMLDTPSYFDSRWTRQEIGRARAKEIQVLRVIWPEHKPNKLTDLAETIYLETEDLEGSDGPIRETMAETIVLRVERLRSLSIAARYMSITGKLRADVQKIGASVEAIGAHRAIAVRLLDDRRIWAYPIVGIPTAEVFNDVANKARRADQREIPVVVYDHLGIRDTWVAHLNWLDEHIRAVRAIKVSEAGWTLAAWEG
ncbi:TIR domain protein [Syntrophotalea carbinolica DSM 2380]|uniref:TIR domain protein n=1 Tax=Syntrophotalea carbinolica (strain DSM 2380 / NBRC 103641 / GraBd1) TaxID=338963 RepID=Q3A0F6_SYNC1|nr:toll/interleukin-1 receptor domain-containing protein [Syntrophotalea carbinolica]ABA90151.3 TIR domain protein [Syntrophotalea carbinolica DSM 2380]